MSNRTLAYDLIAFDLDGTLLDNRKGLPEANLRALRAAGERGCLLVPATGRIPAGLPQELLALPGLGCGILVNGALLYDFAAQRPIGREEIELNLALRVLDFLDAQGVLYDCYQDNWGYVDRRFYDSAEAYIADPGILALLKNLRTPVPDLREYLRQKGESVQKLQLHTRDGALRQRLLEELPERFPELSVTSSVPTNVELNSARANKGRGLQSLCALLGLKTERCLAFGDGSNDIALLRAAGLGVAMANASPEVKAAAGLVTASNEEAGVARVIEAVLEGRPLG